MSKKDLEQKVQGALGNLQATQQAIATGNEAKENLKEKQKELVADLTKLENYHNDEERSVIVLAEQLLQKGLGAGEKLVITIQVCSPELLAKFNKANACNVEHSEEGACIVLDPFRSEQAKRFSKEFVQDLDNVRNERRNIELNRIQQLSKGMIPSIESPSTLFAAPIKECKCPPVLEVAPMEETESTTSKQKRGRKPKNKEQTATKPKVTTAKKESTNTETPKKRGRPRKQQEQQPSAEDAQS